MAFEIAMLLQLREPNLIQRAHSRPRHNKPPMSFEELGPKLRKHFSEPKVCLPDIGVIEHAVSEFQGSPEVSENEERDSKLSTAEATVGKAVPTSGSKSQGLPPHTQMLSLESIAYLNAKSARNGAQADDAYAVSPLLDQLQALTKNRATFKSDPASHFLFVAEPQSIRQTLRPKSATVTQVTLERLPCVRRLITFGSCLIDL